MAEAEATLESLGSYALKGLAAPVAVFALPAAHV